MNKTLGRSRCIWEDYSKLDLKEIKREGVGCIPVVGSCESDNGTSGLYKAQNVLSS